VSPARAARSRTAPWEIPEEDFHTLVAPSERTKFLLRYAVLAPSGHNSQPWRFRVEENRVAILADRSRRLPIADPQDRELAISIGAAILNLRVAAAHFGHSCEVEACDEPGPNGLLATARLRETARPDPELRALFAAVPLRRTNRGRFLTRPLEPEHRERILAVSPTSGSTGFRLVSGSGTLRDLARLVTAADRIQFADPAYRAELARWIRPRGSRREDGIPGDAAGFPAPAASVAPWLVGSFDLGGALGRSDARHVRDAAAIAVFHAEDRAPSWMEAGELLERFLLTATLLGVQVAFLNQVVQVRRTREELREMLRLADWPQIVARIGYGRTPKLASPRRPLGSVLSEPEVWT
jgi:nitroreductase